VHTRSPMVDCGRGPEATTVPDLQRPQAPVGQLTGPTHSKEQQQQQQPLVLAKADSRLNCCSHASAGGASPPGGQWPVNKQQPQQVEMAVDRNEAHKQSLQQQQQQHHSKQLTQKRQRIPLKPSSSTVQLGTGWDASDDEFV